METNETLPHLDRCPFCDNKAGFEYPYPSYYARENKFLGGVWVSCMECFCEVGRAGWDTQEEDCGHFDSFQEAADAWNRRS